MARKITGQDLTGSWAGILYFKELRPFFPDEEVTLELWEDEKPGRMRGRFHMTDWEGAYSIESGCLVLRDLRNRLQLEFIIEADGHQPEHLRGRLYADGRRDVCGCLIMNRIIKKEA